MADIDSVLMICVSKSVMGIRAVSLRSHQGLILHTQKRKDLMTVFYGVERRMIKRGWDVHS